jgi:DnaJ-class molecular chaperone
LRLKGKGLRKQGGGNGDLYVTLKIMLPASEDAELTEFARRWSAAHAFDPRRNMGG